MFKRRSLLGLEVTSWTQLRWGCVYLGRTRILRVITSKIPSLKLKRVQHQDSWVCPSKTKLRDLDTGGTSAKSHVEAAGL